MKENIPLSVPEIQRKLSEDELLARSLYMELKRHLVIAGSAHLKNKHDIEQAIHDVILKLLDYQKEKPIIDIYKLSYSIMKNTSIDIARKNHLRNKKEVSTAPEGLPLLMQANPYPTPFELFELQEKIPLTKILDNTEDLNIINQWMDMIPSKKIAESLPEKKGKKRTYKWVDSRLQKIRKKIKVYICQNGMTINGTPSFIFKSKDQSQDGK